MSKETKNTLPSYLVPLLQPTPSGMAKLIAAWDGLSAETQIQIISAQREAGIPSYLGDRLWRKALESSNAYVRYLAARELRSYSDDEEETVKQRIENDSDPLVRYSLLENRLPYDLDDDPGAFFKLPHDARLAKIRNLRGRGKAFASLITHAVNNSLSEGIVSEDELFEILADYIGAEFEDYYGEGLQDIHDGLFQYEVGVDIEALWKLVPQVPERISHILIAHLPEQAGLKAGIPQIVLDELTPRQLVTLLHRRDVGLEDLRRTLFLKPAERLDQARIAAISSHFDLSYDDFLDILQKPENEKIAVLSDLASSAQDLSLVFYEVTHDILSTSDYGSGMGVSRYAEYASLAFDRKMDRLPEAQRTKELTELRLFRLAKQAVPWAPAEAGNLPQGDLVFLARVTVNGNTWQTFTNFSDQWAKKGWQAEKLGRLLPRIYEAGEEDEYTEEAVSTEDETAPEEALIDQVETRMTDLLATTVDQVETRMTDLLASITESQEEKKRLEMEELRALNTEDMALDMRSRTIREILQQDHNWNQLAFVDGMAKITVLNGTTVWKPRVKLFMSLFDGSAVCVPLSDVVKPGDYLKFCIPNEATQNTMDFKNWRGIFDRETYPRASSTSILNHWVRFTSFDHGLQFSVEFIDSPAEVVCPRIVFYGADWIKLAKKESEYEAH